MGDLSGEIKRIGLAPDQERNHWKRGIPQNPETIAYKVYQYHLTHPPCSMHDLARAVGVPPRKTLKIKFIVEKLRKAKTWRWPARADYEHNQSVGQRRALGMFGDN